MNAEVIGEKIKNLREKNNISRENFANAVEISQSALSMYENGQRIPRDEVLISYISCSSPTILSSTVLLCRKSGLNAGKANSVVLCGKADFKGISDIV